MRLSVIVPSLTGGVPESLRRQVAERPDVELIVVKGVSPVGRARNEGLKRATGEYIAWVDCDDEVADDWLKEILAAISSEPDVVVIGHAWMFNATLKREMIWRGGDLLADVLAQRGLRSELWNYVIRRSLWHGVVFDETARVAEDWDVVPTLLVRARSVKNVAKTLYRYWVRESSLTHERSEDMQREILERAIGRVDKIKRLGLWRKYGRFALVGIAYVVYCCAETLTLGGNGNSATKRQAVQWIRRKIVALLLTPAPQTFKVKWVLAATGLWRVVKWYYRRQERCT